MAASTKYNNEISGLFLSTVTSRGRHYTLSHPQDVTHSKRTLKRWHLDENFKSNETTFSVVLLLQYFYCSTCSTYIVVHLLSILSLHLWTLFCTSTFTSRFLIRSLNILDTKEKQYLQYLSLVYIIYNNASNHTRFLHTHQFIHAMRNPPPWGQN